MNFIEVIRSSEQKVSTWSGGTTTELYIYPKEALYSERNFMFRISSAKVELEESNFTSLPGIDRKIMILDGELKLVHENHYEKNLGLFDKDSFKGDWTTRSFGKVTDFNLMTNSDCCGDIKHLKVSGNNFVEIGNIETDIEFNNITYAIYCLGESISAEIDDIEITLNKEDLLVISSEKDKHIKLKNNLNEDVDIILNNIYIY